MPPTVRHARFLLAAGRLGRLVARLRGLLHANAFLLWGALVGVIGALATVAFRDGLAFLQSLLFGHAGSFVEIATALPWQARLLVPCAGGLLAGCLLVPARRVGAGARADYMEAVAVGDGRVPVGLTLLNSASSLLSIASGGSIGREGSMIQLAAMSASVTGRLAGFATTRLRLLVACGAAAGIAAAYNAPIASAFFVTEIILGAITMGSLGPIMVASVVANITMRRLPGYHPTYEMPAFAPVANLEVAWFVALGVLAGLAAPAFLYALQQARRLFAAGALPLPLRLALGGLGVGAISVWVPQVWGNGYSVVNGLLHQSWLWQAVLLVLACKIVATLLTSGSGAIGGIFTPTLFVGAAVGHLFALLPQALSPATASTPAAYVAVGMGATLAAATSAPLMAILMIFEMTLSYSLMLPLMLACVAAHAVARAVGGPSMYEITARRAADETERERLHAVRMRELVRPAETVLPEQAAIADAAAMFRQHAVRYLYLVDARGRYRGAVALQDVAALYQECGEAAGGGACAAIARTDGLPLVTAGMGLDDALRQFMRHFGERLPAVASDADPELLGAVHKTDVLDAYVRLNQAPLGIHPGA
ncbi:ClcB-like voltage-gated chloride channel protein [uncultured Massilia sp.]|uniref:ClcB-like voltage-gated chloride channel protein n=1 Tax=uncultured Massilia sp. TaxID=169973 RepID=UPI0025F715FE|nr:ClcB-like voltage-gated chloride channel protein [uncultured Massilia sp.]